jgi:hypothetical protein
MTTIALDAAIFWAVWMGLTATLNCTLLLLAKYRLYRRLKWFNKHFHYKGPDDYEIK